jgi:hypothetical protein
MSNILSTAPGVVQPTVLPFPAGSNSARTGAIALQNENNRSQISLLTTTGGKRKRYKKGGATQIAVPTMQVLYPETGAGNQTVNGNITATTTLGATSSANSIYDVCVGQGPSCTSQVTSSQTAGKRYKRQISTKRKRSKRKRSKKGGIKWGCYSGGSKKHRKSKKKYRKYK